MDKSAYLNGPPELEASAPRGVSTSSDISIVILRSGCAGNDATCEDLAISKEGAEAWAQHALATNALGHAAITDTASSARPTRYPLRQVGGGHPSFTLGEIIVVVIQEVVAIALQAHERRRQRRHARAVRDALRQLDDHLLRDLGLNRGEIAWVAAQVAGVAECTRVRNLRTSQMPSTPRA